MAGTVCAQYDYGQLMGMSYKFYAAERVGPLPGNYTIPWRGSAYLQEANTKVAGFTNMTGGFMTGGNAGTLKMTIPTAFTLSMLAWGMLEFPEASHIRNTDLCLCPAPFGMAGCTCCSTTFSLLCDGCVLLGCLYT